MHEDTVSASGDATPSTGDGPTRPRLPDAAPPRDLEPASVHVIVAENRTRIVISGEVDADLVPDLNLAMHDAEATALPIDVDAQHVSFMDSSGIAFLARLASRTTVPVRLLNAPDAVRFLLEVTRIGELLELVDDSSPADGSPVDED